MQIWGAVVGLHWLAVDEGFASQQCRASTLTMPSMKSDCASALRTAVNIFSHDHRTYGLVDDGQLAAAEDTGCRFFVAGVICGG